MNKKEYFKAKKALEEEFKAKDEELAKQFAASNNPVKIGDVITDKFLVFLKAKNIYQRTCIAKLKIIIKMISYEKQN